MEIAGVIILTVPEKTMQVQSRLDELPSITTYGVYKSNHIVAVLEGQSPRELENLAQRLTDTIPGVLGVFPAYVNSDNPEGESSPSPKEE